MANLFASLDTFMLGDDSKILEEWFRSPTYSTSNNPLGFWAVQLNGANSAFAQMALDFLSVPGMLTYYTLHHVDTKLLLML